MNRQDRTSRSAIGLTALCFASIWLQLTVAFPAEAQYFGQNKVQFDRFDFSVLETPHFDIYYYPSEAKAARDVARLSERWYDQLSTRLQHQLSGRQPVILYASHPEFEQTNVIEGLINEATGGVTEGAKRRVVLPLAATLRETDHVLGHELVHAFQYDILGRNIEALPLWVVEGMAEYFSIGSRDPQTAMWLRDAAREGRLPEIRDLDDPRYFPYRFGHGFWAYIAGRYGELAVVTVLHRFAREVGGGPNPVAAVEAVTGEKQEALSTAWHESVLAAYGITERASDTKEPIASDHRVFQSGGDAQIDVGPALSPDGRRIAFLSERSRLAVELYVADAATGENLRQLTKTAIDPHFQSLQFLASAGSWSPDSRRLAVATVRKGRGSLAIFDADSGRIIREIALEVPGELFGPSWSPDGRAIVVSAQIGGYTDLFLADPDAGTMRRLTDDPFADLQPAWSNDGRRLAFVTDRFSTNIDTLTFGRYQIAEMDVASARVSPLVASDRGDLVNPAWGPDDQLFYISTESGRPEIYRRTSATSGEPVTRVLTGIAGITPLSTALSVSSSARTMAFTVFTDGEYQIRFAPTGASTDDTAAIDFALLPPVGRQAEATVAAVRPGAGSPASTQPTGERPYRAALSLVDIGQAVGVGVGSGAFGTYLSGGISMLFSDVLGNHLLPATFSIDGGVKDIGAQVGYINRTRRWNWGVFAERIPLLSGTVQPTFEIIDGQEFYVETTALQRQTSTQASLVVAYPFTRSLRAEVSGGMRHIGFSEEVERLVFDPFSGALLERSILDESSLPSLRLVEGTASLVGDSSAFGAVSPILGQRFRLDVSPTWGDLRMVSATADYRRYVVPVRPLTIAVRALHLGRYGAGAEDQRLWPFFLGYSTLVRGYDPDSFTGADCTPTVADSCPELNRLIGSRLAVINAEVRMPIGGFFTGDYDYGPLPVEVFGFMDAGLAWSRVNGLWPDANQTWSRSAGFGARVNLLGYAIGEFNLARALDRRTDEWRFVFNLRPGF